MSLRFLSAEEAAKLEALGENPSEWASGCTVDERIANALESIAVSLAKMANPLVAVADERGIAEKVSENREVNRRHGRVGQPIEEALGRDAARFAGGKA